MRTQGNISQRKEQDKTPEKELSEMKAGSVTNTELKTRVTRVLNEFREIIDELSEKSNRETKNKNKNKQKKS